MTHRSESQTEATVENLLSTRAITNIGTWNIRTLFETGKTAHVSTERRRYKIAVLGLCETRWTQSGQIRLSTGENLLYSTLEQRTKRDILIVMGDFNAKIGSDNFGREYVMGSEGLGQINENGELFADFCSFNNIVIGGSLFRHKRIHKATWISPDHYTENQIDHITICKEFRRSLQDTRVRRGADAASDHHLVVGRLKLKLKRFFKTSPKPSHPYNTALLKDAATRDKFTLELSNRFQALSTLSEEAGSAEEMWEKSKTAWKKACDVVLKKKNFPTQRVALCWNSGKDCSKKGKESSTKHR